MGALDGLDAGPAGGVRGASAAVMIVIAIPFLSMRLGAADSGGDALNRGGLSVRMDPGAPSATWCGMRWRRLAQHLPKPS
ncbi:MAG: hypothetical protein ACR2LV_00465 [Solirubrobacteraceae bacterium]